MNPKSKIPEPDRLIRCKGHDWSPFEITGMWVLYKKQKPGGKSGRFMTKHSTGEWLANSAWQDVETWEYVDGEK